MPSDMAVVTLCDANYFPGLLMLHQSVQQSFPCTLACYDLGCTQEQRDKAAKLENLLFLPLPDDPLVDEIRVAMDSAAPLAKPNKRVWPLWICPLLIKHAPFRDVIWMDCDLVVLRNLSGLFDALEGGPVFTPENKAPELTANRPELYTLLPITRRFDPQRPMINAGVSAWRLSRDAGAIDAYLLPVRRAVEDVSVRNAIAWHDQGALIWAIQSCGLEDRVLNTNKWNLCVDHTDLVARPAPWDQDFLATVRRRVPDVNVVHWNGRMPPWINPEARS